MQINGKLDPGKVVRALNRSRWVTFHPVNGGQVEIMENKSIKLTEEKSFPGSVSDDVVWWNIQDLHDAGELLNLVLSGKDGVSRVQLGQDAA